MSRRSTHGKRRRQGGEKLPYSPNLGVHHMFFEARHYTTHTERTLRNFGAFILGTHIAKPPQHTLLHMSMTEPPKPIYGEALDILDTARHGGLEAVTGQLDTRVTEHLRQQLAILAIPTQEAVERLTSKLYVTKTELAKLAVPQVVKLGASPKHRGNLLRGMV